MAGACSARHGSRSPGPCPAAAVSGCTVAFARRPNHLSMRSSQGAPHCSVTPESPRPRDTIVDRRVIAPCLEFLVCKMEMIIARPPQIMAVKTARAKHEYVKCFEQCLVQGGIQRALTSIFITCLSATKNLDNSTCRVVCRCLFVPSSRTVAIALDTGENGKGSLGSSGQKPRLKSH